MHSPMPVAFPVIGNPNTSNKSLIKPAEIIDKVRMNMNEKAISLKLFFPAFFFIFIIIN